MNQKDLKRFKKILEESKRNLLLSARKTLTEEGEGPGHDGKLAKFKSVSTMSDNDTMEFKMYQVADGKETEMMSITYKRKK